MKKIVLLFAIVLTACFHAVLPTVETTAIPAGATVVILGDSLTHGTGAKKGKEDYPTLLAKSTNWKIINAGVHGNTSSQGLQRLPALLKKHQPKLLIVELGGNDLMRKVPVAQLESNLKTMLAMAKKQKIPTALVAIPDPNPFLAVIGFLLDHSVYEKVAEETQTPLITDVFSDVIADSDLRSDNMHPNAEGYRQVAEGMEKALIELGYLNK